MRKILQIILACFIVSSFMMGCKKGEGTPNILEVFEEKQEDVYAMWFSYLDYQEILQNQNEESFREGVEEIVQNLEELGINTIYLHAVAFTDALYESSILPESNSLPNITYDPLKIFIEIAHAHKIKVEAWVNPLRSFKIEEMEYYKEDSILKEWYLYNDERLRPVGERYYLNPAYPEVRSFVCSFVKEILDNYEVDGIHMDDYFYPDEASIAFDAYIYGEENYKNPISLEEFRMNAVNKLVKEIHDTVKRKSQDLTFGISVAGNYDVDIQLYYADPVQWKNEGTIDYLIPQVYWGFEHPTKPYTSTLKEWREMMDNSKVKVYSGLAAYKIGTEDFYADGSQEWIENSDMIARQIETAFELDCPGFAIFRYNSLYHPSPEVEGNVEKEIINIKNEISHHKGVSE